ncbi:MAG: hypothetical protein US76_02915 [Parcubacteria group bacterium GW2011_GWA2_38_13b]|nr:MAG: hypothetical protein US76_02915 [Parcubacteria group bacterium GW2011_GWA2_38_13b]
MFLTIIIFILILSVLVLVHEMGHFFVAKNRRIKVEEFGFGFPPRVFSVKRGETIYSINAIPIGGFVKMYGEDGENELKISETDRAFFSKKIWERAVVIVAGVTMNVVLAAFLLSIGHWLGLPAIIDDSNRNLAANSMVQIMAVAPDSPASKIGIKIGDSIKYLKTKNENLKVVENVQDVQAFIDIYRGEEIVFGIISGDENIELAVVPRVNPPEGEGAVGIAMGEVGFIKYPWYVAIWKGFESVYFMFIMMIAALGGIIKSLFIGKPIGGDIAGPVGIVMLVNQVSKLGIVYILQFAAIISVNLALINILPFPALDGGRILFLIIEKIKGSPVNQNIESLIHRIGFTLLILLMVFITFKDIVKLL